MTTRRAKVHRLLVCYEKNAKRALREPGLGLMSFVSTPNAWNWYGQWKKKKQPRGTAEKD